MEAVLERPISVRLCAGIELKACEKGQIFDAPICHIEHPTQPNAWIVVTQPNHAVLLVGYGSSRDETDYWILQNSWGETGETKGSFSRREGETYSSLLLVTQLFTYICESGHSSSFHFLFILLSLGPKSRSTFTLKSLSA
ncbi:hypothetical protein TSUD_347580 [Trifolium subterraneum]|nr:hypothetical protein TSUD_347580 [Trifolium subterraneum]